MHKRSWQMDSPIAWRLMDVHLWMSWWTQSASDKKAKGYYQYTLDRKGKPKKSVDPEVAGMIATVQANGGKEFSKEEIQERMMIPMLIETIRCFEEGIVDTPNEADMALIFGIGFPPFLGGALHYADLLGLDKVCEMADKYAHLGKLYEPTPKNA